jgi:hypothetical protein
LRYVPRCSPVVNSLASYTERIGKCIISHIAAGTFGRNVWESQIITSS